MWLYAPKIWARNLSLKYIFLGEFLQGCKMSSWAFGIRIWKNIQIAYSNVNLFHLAMSIKMCGENLNCHSIPNQHVQALNGFLIHVRARSCSLANGFHCTASANIWAEPRKLQNKKNSLTSKPSRKPCWKQGVGNDPTRMSKWSWRFS